MKYKYTNMVVLNGRSGTNKENGIPFPSENIKQNLTGQIDWINGIDCMSLCPQFGEASERGMA
jgi:hypothetical protein